MAVDDRSTGGGDLGLNLGLEGLINDNDDEFLQNALLSNDEDIDFDNISSLISEDSDDFPFDSLLLNPYDKKSCTCKECGKVFNSVWYLKQHAVKHSSERPFKCKHCHKTYRFRSNLYQHKCPFRQIPILNNGGGPLDFVSNSTNRNQKRRSHVKDDVTMTSHQQKNLFDTFKTSIQQFWGAKKGEKCQNSPFSPSTSGLMTSSASRVVTSSSGKMTSSRETMTSSPLRAPSAVPVPTPEEIRRFLDRHKDLLFKCPTCKIYFPTEQYLIRHTSWHTVEDQKTKCTLCSEIFHNDQQYGLHKQLHVPQSYHVCTHCKGKFCHYLALKRHAKRCRTFSRFTPMTPTPENGWYNPVSFIDQTPPPSPATSPDGSGDFGDAETTVNVSRDANFLSRDTNFESRDPKFDHVTSLNVPSTQAIDRTKFNVPCKNQNQYNLDHVTSRDHVMNGEGENNGFLLVTDYGGPEKVGDSTWTPPSSDSNDENLHTGTAPAQMGAMGDEEDSIEFFGDYAEAVTAAMARPRLKSLSKNLANEKQQLYEYNNNGEIFKPNLDDHNLRTNFDCANLDNANFGQKNFDTNFGHTNFMNETAREKNSTPKKSPVNKILLKKIKMTSLKSTTKNRQKKICVSKFQKDLVKFGNIPKNERACKYCGKLNIKRKHMKKHEELCGGHIERQKISDTADRSQEKSENHVTLQQQHHVTLQNQHQRHCSIVPYNIKHVDVLKLRCPYCVKRFTSQRLLKQHLANHEQAKELADQ